MISLLNLCFSKRQRLGRKKEQYYSERREHVMTEDGEY